MVKKNKAKSITSTTTTKITTTTFSFPLKLPPPPINLQEREKSLSFSAGLEAKRLKTAGVEQKKPNEQSDFRIIFTPQVLFYTPSKCQAAAAKRASKPLGDREKAFHRKMSILLIAMFSRSSASVSPSAGQTIHHHPQGLSGPILQFMSQYFGYSCIFPYQQPASASSALNFLNPLPASASPSAYKWACGVRLYHALQQMKYSLLNNPDLLTVKTGGVEEKLAEYWAECADRTSIVKNAVNELKSVVLSKTWCQCNACKHRRMGSRELLEQIHKAVIEDMDGYLSQSEFTDQSKSRRSLYRSIALVSTSLLNARNRPIFDILTAFKGLKFTDKDDKKPNEESCSEDSDDEGFIEYPQFCSSGSPPANSDEDYDFNCDELLDFSDDEDLIEAAEGELGIDECELIGPISVATRRLRLPSVLLHAKAQEMSNDDREEKLVEEGQEIYRLFASEMVFHALLLGVLEEETKARQRLLLLEEEKVLCGKKTKKGRKKKSESVIAVEENVAEEEVVHGAIEAIAHHAVATDQEEAKQDIAPQNDKVVTQDTVKTGEQEGADLDTPCDEYIAEDEPVVTSEQESKHEQEHFDEQESKVHPEDEEIDHLISLGLREMAINPPGFEAPPGFDPENDLIEHTCDERSLFGKLSDPFNYLTSSLFGPSLIWSVVDKSQ